MAVASNKLLEMPEMALTSSLLPFTPPLVQVMSGEGPHLFPSVNLGCAEHSLCFCRNHH